LFQSKKDASTKEIKYQDIQTLQKENSILEEILNETENMHLVYLDRDFNFVRVNEAYAKTCGYKPEEMIGKNHFALYPGEEIEAIFKRVRDTGVSASFHDKPFVFPNQPERGVTYWDWTLKPIKNEAGEVEGLVFSLVETTERKKAEEENKNLAKFPSENPSPVLRIDRNGTLLFCNDAAKQILKASRCDVGEVVSKSWRKFVDAAFASRKRQEFEEQIGERTFIFAISPLTDYVNVYGLDITKRKKTEDEIRRLKERFELAQQAASAGVWDWDVKTGRIDWTPEMFRLFGLNPKKTIASFETWEAVLHPEDREKARANIDEALKTHSFLNNVYRIIRPDGKIIWINGLGKGEYDEQNQPVRMSGICIDITERKKAEKELRKSEERYRSYIEVTGELGWTTNAEGEVIEDLPSWRNFTGQTFDEIKGFGWSKALHPDDVKNTLRVWRQAIREKSKYEVEYRIRRHDGVYRCFLARGVPVLNADGSLREWVGTCIDITERKKADNILQEQNVAINSAPDAIFSTNSSFVIRSWNKAAESIFGWKAEEVIGKASTSIFNIHYPTLNGVSRKRALKKLMDTGFWKGEVIYYTKNNSPIPVSVSVSLLKDKDDKAIGTVAVIHDISKRRRREKAMKRTLEIAQQRAEELEKLQVQLEEKAAEVEEVATRMEDLAEERAMKLKDAERLAAIGATAGMVGHDIRNPLQSILNELYLAKMELINIPKGQGKTMVLESLKGIETEITYIDKIVRDLQDYAKSHEVHLVVVNLEELFQKLLMENDFPENIKAKYCVEEKTRKFFSDPALLERIVTNLVNNAVQAMPEGGRLEIQAQQDNGDVLITVQDSGVGIPSESRDKLFTPLFTTKSKGQGFGLAVVKRLTEVLGGSVNYESEEGKGTKFIVCLPVAKK
jgi:two-component system NtrC family sensor kinase